MPIDATTPDVPRAIARDQSLDMVKGLLVVGMLLVHASNLFVGTPAIKQFVYPTLLGFVSGSWLCISGYIVGLRYRFLFEQNQRAITRRLIGRGWRLVAIFIVSNILLGNFSPASCFGYEGAGGCDLTHIFLLGDDEQAFEVLLGIGYLLLIAPVCLWLPTRILAVATLFLVVALSAVESSGVELPLLSWMLASGVAGIVIGSFARPQLLRDGLENPRVRLFGVSLALFIWLVTEAFFLSSSVSNISPVFYVPHVVSSLWLLYVAGGSLARVGWLMRPLTVMAHYSLLAYMGQMAILQVWFVIASDMPLARYFPVSIVVAFVTLLASLYLLSALRSKLPIVNKMYLSVFG